MNRIVQGLVVCGVWWGLFVDVLGNYAGQDHDPSWIPVIWGTSIVLGVVHGCVLGRLLGSAAECS